MKVLLISLLLSLFLGNSYASDNLYSLIVNPENNIKLEEDTTERKIQTSMRFLSVPPEKHKMVARSVKLATRETGIDANLIMALMYTESEFNPRAISKKGYKGLMQTPIASFEYPEVDTLYGALILKEKMRIANGNLLDALSLYKGGRNKVARRYAKETIKLYNVLEKIQ